MKPLTRRRFLKGAGAGALALSWSSRSWPAEQAQPETIHAEIEKRHDEAVQRLQRWIRQPSIAAENRAIVRVLGVHDPSTRRPGVVRRQQELNR